MSPFSCLNPPGPACPRGKLPAIKTFEFLGFLATQWEQKETIISFLLRLVVSVQSCKCSHFTCLFHFPLQNFQCIQDILHHYVSHLLTFIPPTYPPPQTLTSSSLHFLFESPSIPITTLHPVFPCLSLKKRQCVLICQSDAVLLWRWWGSVMLGHTHPAARSLERLDD